MRSIGFRALAMAALMVVTNSCGPDDPAGLEGLEDLGQAQGGMRERTWPTARVTDYSSAYRIGTIKAVGVDDAYNLWLLDYENRIGVLRQGEAQPRWFSRVGQAGRGFTTFTVCGGAANRAYVGYLARELPDPVMATPQEKMEGDADVVRLNPDGSVELEEHLVLVNTNDARYDETRSILSCAKVMRGPYKGEVYLGTNHAVTRLRGTEISDHRHSVWAAPNGSLRIGYNWAVSITQDGDVFLANEWKVAVLGPTPRMRDWISGSANPWKLDTFVPNVGRLEDMDYWRATAQTTDRKYYVGSLNKGLWEIQRSPRRYTQVVLPTNNINALAATDDGSLFIGTGNRGLWRLTKDKKLEPVADVPGKRITQLVYDPTVSPSMLYAISDGKLFVLRGY